MKFITLLITLTFSLINAQGWHESFNLDAQPSNTGQLNLDYTWYWWTWGTCYTDNGSLVLQGEAPNPMNATRWTSWIQTDDGAITPDSATIYVKIKAVSSSTDSAHAFYDQIHIPVAADPLFLANKIAYTVVIGAWNGVVADYYFATEDFNSSPAPGVGYGHWFWVKIVSSGNDVSVWTYADGDEPTETPTHTFSTTNVTTFAPMQFMIAVTNEDSTMWYIDDFYYNMEPTVGIADENLISNEFQLHQNFPNPFNPHTTISFDLKENSQINLSVFNVNGQLVKELDNGFKPAGLYRLNFSGEALPSGIYFYKLKTNNTVLKKKMLLLK